MVGGPTVSRSSLTPHGTATAISPDRPQRRPCRWKPSQGSSPKFSLNFCPFYFPFIYEFDSQLDPARQRSAVATISSSSVFSVSSVRDIFMRCLARSRSVDSQISQSAPPAELPLAVYLDLPKVSFRPSGCLRQGWFAFLPECLTLRAAYAAYRATALLLGSRPAPAGTCSGFASTSTTRRRGGAGGRWHRFRVRGRG